MPDNMLDSSPAPYVLQYEVVLAGFEARALTELETNLGDAEFWVTLAEIFAARAIGGMRHKSIAIGC